MTNAELIQKIRAEIERLRDEYTDIAIDSHYGAVNANHVVDDLEQLLSFLSTLESEKPMNLDLEIEIENAGKDVIRQAHYHNKIFDIPQTHFEDVQLMDIFKAGVYKGCELGRNEK